MSIHTRRKRRILRKEMDLSQAYIKRASQAFKEIKKSSPSVGLIYRESERTWPSCGRKRRFYHLESSSRLVSCYLRRVEFQWRLFTPTPPFLLSLRPTLKEQHHLLRLVHLLSIYDLNPASSLYSQSIAGLCSKVSTSLLSY